MTTDNIREVTQSIIAVLIVGGGGYILFAQPASSAIPFVASIITAVVTFYFTRSQNQSIATRAANLAVEGTKP